MKSRYHPTQHNTYLAAICTFVIALLLSIAPVLSQASYSVIRKGKQIGTLQTYTTQTPAGRLYGLSMNVNARVIIPMQVQVQIVNLCNAKNDLTEASYSKAVNKSSPTLNQIRLNATGYDLIANSKTSKLSGIISCSTLLLYFIEPVQQQQVFSETHLQWLTLHKIAEGAYRINTPDGYHTTYWFQQGVLQKVESENMFGPVQIVKR